MDLGTLPSSRDFVKCCNCGCSCDSIAGTSDSSWLRSVKRKYDEFESEGRFSVPGSGDGSVARVEFENECFALREMVGNQQQTIQDLYSELEEERNAASTAANETMDMILRLQREKAEIQMEARQFKRFAEEKMEHDQSEILAVEDLLYKREQALQSLAFEIQAYKHRLMSFGLTEAEAEGGGSLDFDARYEIPMYEYPPLRCSAGLNEPHGGDYDHDYDEVADIEKYAFGETPRERDDNNNNNSLKGLERRINRMERSPSASQIDGERNVLDKVVVGSPRRSRHARKFSSDSSSLRGTTRENGGNPNAGFFKKTDNGSDFGDDTNDRVYTIDSVHDGGYAKLKAENGTASPREPSKQGDASEPDIKKLYMRLQALEADRESMRQTIFSMGTDKAQLVLLKEIAQQLCKERSIERQVAVKRPSFFGRLSFLPVFKWIMSFVFWRRKASRTKYLFGVAPNDVGLLMVLDKGPRTKPWRCLRSTQI